MPGRHPPRFMKQILQSLANGETLLAEVPAPAAPSGGLRIATRASLVSLGTERMLLEFGRANYLEKARQQPERVKQVLATIKTEGLWSTFEAVRSKLAEPLVLGYCNAGIVLEVGAGVQGWQPGDRVLSNGPHAEVVAVPANLCAKIPDSVADAHAPFAVTGAIALQGIRLLQPTLGENFMVTGLGLIGLLAVQLLKAHGCRVLGVDFDSAKCALARQFGAETADLSRGEDPVALARAFTGGRGLDGVLIAASTKSSEPVAQAAQACRKRGRIVLVGVAGLELNRADFYEKELSFQVSCSYGPGRYDPAYEEQGHDYPLPFVRWTEQRNFEAVMVQMAAGALAIEPLISRRIPFDDALEAYAAVSSPATLGLVLEYDATISSLQSAQSKTIHHTGVLANPSSALVIGVLGAGAYTTRVLLPALQGQDPLRFKAIVSARGVTAAQAARRYGFAVSSTDPATVLADPEINLIFITSYHGAHASQALAALAAGKHVFVEKPLCLTLDELAALERASAGARSLLMVGYNRRFSPHVVKMKSLLEGVRAPRAMVYTVNAGRVPPSHWQFDPVTGGGRVIGEACHFVDTLRFLAGAPIVASRADFLGGPDGRLGDVVTLHLRFADGSIGSVHYLANGHPKLPKERLEVFCAGRVLQMDNFRRLTGYGWNGFKNFKTWNPAKGHVPECAAFLDAVRQGRPSPIPPEEIFEISRVTMQLAQAQTASAG
jgi:predicted dehydrogenase/threonine dehydrogenase-like Zn-dependent dehydrogenase